MDQATVQKLHKAIETRVKAEIAWHDCLQARGGQKPEHKPVFDKLFRARRAVAKILEREFDPAMYDAMAKAHRRAFTGKEPTGAGFEAVPE